MEFIINDLTDEQLIFLKKYNKDDLINILSKLQTQKEKRNNYHRLYYNKLKDDETKINKIKSSRKEYYSIIKNDSDKYKEYLQKMKQYNKNYLDRNKIKMDIVKPEKPIKTIKLNYVIKDDNYYIININKLINNFDDIEIINKNIKQLIINKNEVQDIFFTNDIFNEDNIKNYLLNNYNNIIKIKSVIT